MMRLELLGLQINALTCWLLEATTKLEVPRWFPCSHVKRLNLKCISTDMQAETQIVLRTVPDLPDGSPPADRWSSRQDAREARGNSIGSPQRIIGFFKGTSGRNTTNFNTILIATFLMSFQSKQH